jgi:hypothetical protein
MRGKVKKLVMGLFKPNALQLADVCRPFRAERCYWYIFFIVQPLPGLGSAPSESPGFTQGYCCLTPSGIEGVSGHLLTD